MILTPEIEQQILDAIAADPTEPVTLPDWAYGKDGRCVILVDRIPIDLHRHLYGKLIRPLGYRERTLQCGPVGNVNPYLFGVPLTGQPLRTHCNKGHAYAGNEAPPNSRGYRCLTCLRDSYRKTGSTPNGMKTQCPSNHDYTPENTITGKDGRRRCRTCKNTRNAAAMRRRRKESK